MAKKRIIEEQPWWPDALVRLEELATDGETRSSACRIIGNEFGRSTTGILNAIERGSVHSFPPRDPDPARAWLAGETTYEGKECAKHGTTTRYANDGICYECMFEYARRQREKSRVSR